KKHPRKRPTQIFHWREEAFLAVPPRLAKLRKIRAWQEQMIVCDDLFGPTIKRGAIGVVLDRLAVAMVDREDVRPTSRIDRFLSRDAVKMRDRIGARYDHFPRFVGDESNRGRGGAALVEMNAFAIGSRENANRISRLREV